MSDDNPRENIFLGPLRTVRGYFDKLCSQAPTGFRLPALTGRRPPYQKRSSP